MSMITSRLSKSGIITFRASSRKQFRDFIAALGPVVPHRDSGEDGLTVIETDASREARAGNRGFGTGALIPHTDASGNPEPPTHIALYCEEDSAEGGETTLIDGQELYSQLQWSHPEAVTALGRPGSAIYSSGSASHLGAVFERAQDGGVQIRLRLDECGFFSTDAIAHLPSLQSVALGLVRTFRLSPGEGYAINNTRFLHGRRPFMGSRRMLRLHFNMMEG